MNKNIIFAAGNTINPAFMTNPTPKTDIRKVEIRDGILNPLIEEHKHRPNQTTLFG